MKITKDPEHKTRIRSQSRKSIQEKCKFQFQNSKKKYAHKNQDVEGKEKFQTEVDEQDSSDSQMDDAQLLEYRKKKKQEFVFEVSDFSSSESFDSDLENDQHSEQNANSNQEQHQNACQNLKNLAFSHNISLQSQNTLQLVNSNKSQKHSVITKKQKVLKAFRPALIKKDFQLLRSLKQNQDFLNNELATLEEYKIDREIVVDMDCQDIHTFMRLQNEVEEMRRKQMDFNKQKERHYEIVKNRSQPNKGATKQDENKLWIMMMARKFIKSMKDKKNNKQSSNQPPQPIVRKSTRGSQIKQVS
ncbi:unnamed protein product (macronuclear) [Paramecium tetraurelia]|uniref:Uncharacterized protein n=1 Tax=Paramecium tetraurelia TaxID=5888 RepID=A0CQA2_PARTE|nr:uncharacterized protein GSPATT00009317001 [Paramecium tetraurelia]CAK72969.1 unnamed protein product [Paramecium tetraurelia]|eukprot:XP_001440366.1 hypothetical protein (macronuclear) [Paramecium tetraurelia strain d4-2]